MSLRSIRESYSKLLTAFEKAGVKLTENQKNDVDGFVMAIESTMSKQRESVIRKTKKLVEENLEKKFVDIFNKTFKMMEENHEYASKIQKLSNKITESRKMANEVNEFLDHYIEGVLPKKTIIDYDRMQKLESLHESLKDLLVVNDAEVEAKKTQLDESFKSEKSKCETEVAKLQVKLNESLKKEKALQKKLDSLKSIELLESKTKNLPDFEARAVKKQLAEATAPEIEKKFNKVLESVKAEAKKVAEAKEAEEETTLESEIDKIITDDEDLEENDLLKNKPHNNHLAEGEDEEKKEDKVVEEGEEEFETMESVKFDEAGDVELDEDDVIDAELMKEWCNKSIEVR